MYHYPYAFLLLITFFSLNASAQPETLNCQALFDKLIASEPYLKDELNDLKASCDADYAQTNTGYWLCVQKQVSNGDVNFDRFIISTNVCEGQSSVVFAP